MVLAGALAALACFSWAWMWLSVRRSSALSHSKWCMLDQRAAC
ncbi:hypothetical protein PF003_g9881 [Phytophthora fragariae]|nr:hypothetical protein PF003_g9881 [Phytophthora fragariae]